MRFPHFPPCGLANRRRGADEISIAPKLSKIKTNKKGESIMADIVKRKFYNTGDAKGFTKQIFFNEVLKMARGEEVEAAMADLVAAAAEYELEGIASRTSTSGTGEKKDPLASDYAKALSAAIVPLVDGTPKTAKELIAAATAKGKLAPNGKDFAAPWVSRVLNATDGIVAVKKIVDTVDAKGLKAQREVTAYKRG